MYQMYSTKVQSSHFSVDISVKTTDGKNFFFIYIFTVVFSVIFTRARRGGAEVAGWTLDRKIRVRFPTYPHCVWAL